MNCLYSFFKKLFFLLLYLLDLLFFLSFFDNVIFNFSIGIQLVTLSSGLPKTLHNAYHAVLFFCLSLYLPPKLWKPRGFGFCFVTQACCIIRDQYTFVEWVNDVWERLNFITWEKKCPHSIIRIKYVLPKNI